MSTGSGRSKPLPAPTGLPSIEMAVSGRDAASARPNSEPVRNVLRTLIFYDLFGCPLRIEELALRTFGGLPERWRADAQAMIASDPLLSRHVTVARGYAFLRTVTPDFDRWAAADRSRSDAIRRYAKWVRLMCRIPFVRMVAVTGSLAFPMPSGTPDCDLFVVTSRDRLWIAVAMSRFVFFRILPRLRLIRYGEICPNYMIDDLSSIEPNGDLFDSMQLAAMHRVVGRARYLELVANNKGRRRFFPHWQPPAPLLESPVRMPPGEVQRLLELVLRPLPLDGINRWLFRRLSDRFIASRGHRDEARGAAATAAHFSSSWIRQVFNLAPSSFDFTLHKFKAHDGRKIELLARFEEALRNHPASASIPLA